jgi:uncharacterized protein involved in exopolysaccharide biosynthesis
LRSKIKLNFRQQDIGSGQLPVTSFTITYQSRDPQLAKAIAERVTQLFLKQDSDVRTEQVNGSVEFLEAELNKLNEDLKTSDAKLKVLKARNRNQLPSNLDSNLRRLEASEAAQQQQEELALLAANEKRRFEQLLADTPKEIEKPAAPRSSSTRS